MIYINYFNYMEKINEEMTKLRNDLYDNECSYDDVLDEIYWFIASYRNSRTDKERKFSVNNFIKSLTEKDIINSETVFGYDESLKNYLEKRGEKL